MNRIDKYKGCLIGGAAGDALGYTVEFFKEEEIFAKYGDNGITEYEFHNGIAEVSDDTQMTLFTAMGLLMGKNYYSSEDRIEGYISSIHKNYKDWYRTQTEKFPLLDENECSWLVKVPELFASRAPGMTCLSALDGDCFGTIENSINNSKGCGGVMRVAPIGLYFDGTTLSIDEIDRLGARAAALTHGHSLGYIPAAGLVHIIHLVAHSDKITLAEAIEDMKEAMARQFDGDCHLEVFLQLIDRAVELSNTDMDDLDAIRVLGEGWVAEETLAIAIYCALKYSHDFEQALIASVNHGGDSDSTGAVTGNILGAYLGLKAIPEKYLKGLELREVVMGVAEEMCKNNW